MYYFLPSVMSWDGIEGIPRLCIFGEDSASAYVLCHQTSTVFEFQTRDRQGFGGLDKEFEGLLSSHAKNSISKMTNGWEWRSGVKSGCLDLEWVGVWGTWLQLMCCTVLHCCVPNFGRWGRIGDRRFRGDFVVKTKVGQGWWGGGSKSLSKKRT